MPLPLPLRRPLVSSILPPLSCPLRSPAASKPWHLSCLSFSPLRPSPSFPLLSLARFAPRLFEHSALRASTSPYATAVPPSNEESERAKLAQAPPRAEVVKSLKNGIVVNVLGMGAAILGMQATIGLLVAKALTSSAIPYYQGISPGQSPVLALDVFLVQASANTILSHFLGLVFSLELLRSVTIPHTEAIPIPRVA